MDRGRNDISVVFLLLTLLNTGCMSQLQVPALSSECYTQTGHILLGYILPVTQHSSSSPEVCSGDVRAERMPDVEAVKYVIDRANQNDQILPNISVGFVILDFCGIYSMALGQATHFIPSSDMVRGPEIGPCLQGDAPKQYDVAAVIGTQYSETTVPIALTMSTLKKPVIGTLETSDQLSEGSKFPYFVPFVLPDKYQAQAILQLLAHHNWTFFLFIHSGETWGQNAAKEINKHAESHSLCIEETFILPVSISDTDLAKLYRYFNNYIVSNVVVLYLLPFQLFQFFGSLPPEHYSKFIFITSGDYVSPWMGAAPNGVISVSIPLSQSEEFDKFTSYYQSLTPYTQKSNPWWEAFIAELYDCVWLDSVEDNGENLTDCHLFENDTLPSSASVPSVTAFTLDAAQTLIYGLDIMLRESCPEALNDPSLIGNCIEGSELLDSIKMVSFEGMTGSISFDMNGEIGSGYVFKQYSSLSRTSTLLGQWSIGGGLQLDPALFDWGLYSDGDSGDVPESVCSQPCGYTEYIIQKAVSCCWGCRSCRDNEIIIANRTACEECPENTWPDELLVTCEDIKPVHLSLTDNIGLSLTTIASLGCLLTVMTAALLIIHREAKLIKASSKDLMAVILVGILLAFLSVFVILIEPSAISCFLRDLGFSISITLIYSPLLVKTVRVQRIFVGGQHGQQRLRLISRRSQMILTMILVAIQIILTVAVGIWSPSSVEVRMPVLTTKYSEHLCTLPPTTLAVLISYNLVLLLTCAAVGFLARKLPDNFNETWFIFISVATTTFIWLVFLPTYFTTFYAYHKTALLATCLVLNGLITLVCLFVPKLYAVLFVRDEDIRFVTNPINVISAHAPSASITT